MTDSTQAQDAVRLPVLAMAGAGLVASVCVAVLGGVLGQSRGASMGDGLWTVAPMWFGVVGTAAMLNMLAARPAGLWAAPVLAGTLVRAGVVFVLGFGVYIGVGVDKTVFFLTLVSALVAVLTLDVMTTVRMIQKHEPAGEPGGVVEGS